MIYQKIKNTGDGRLVISDFIARYGYSIEYTVDLNDLNSLDEAFKAKNKAEALAIIKGQSFYAS